MLRAGIMAGVKMPGDCVTRVEWGEIELGTSAFCFVELAILLDLTQNVGKLFMLHFFFFFLKKQCTRGLSDISACETVLKLGTCRNSCAMPQQVQVPTSYLLCCRTVVGTGGLFLTW